MKNLKTVPRTEAVTTELPRWTAAGAKECLETYLVKILTGKPENDAWEMYTFLLEQAKVHKLSSELLAGLRRGRKAA